MTSHVTAVFLVGGSAGSMTLPWLIGRLFDTRGPDWMIYTVGIAMTFALVLFAMIQKRAPSRDSSSGTASGTPLEAA